MAEQTLPLWPVDINDNAEQNDDYLFWLVDDYDDAPRIPGHHMLLGDALESTKMGKTTESLSLYIAQEIVKTVLIYPTL